MEMSIYISMTASYIIDLDLWRNMNILGLAIDFLRRNPDCLYLGQEYHLNHFSYDSVKIIKLILGLFIMSDRTSHGERIEIVLCWVSTSGMRQNDRLLIVH
jgi:hypothetical protein